jgi:predicted dehydrogenase
MSALDTPLRVRSHKTWPTGLESCRDSVENASMKRILLIGLGRWGANHLRILKSMPIELFVADRDEQRLNSAEVPQDHQSTDARALFSKIDAAVVVTPAHTHTSQSVASC